MDNNNTEWRETPAMMLQGLLRNRLKFKFFSKSSFFQSNGTCMVWENCIDRKFSEQTIRLFSTR